jgi:hypothetical protein
MVRVTVGKRNENRSIDLCSQDDAGEGSVSTMRSKNGAGEGNSLMMGSTT